jgi:hypothetical protein
MGVGASGLEPVTPSVSSNVSPVASRISEGLATSHNSACTYACTSEPKTDRADPVPNLAAALLVMTPTDRARLATLLVGLGAGHPEGEHGDGTDGAVGEP